MWKIVCSALVALLLGSEVLGDDLVRALVPVHPRAVLGQFGSSWSSDLYGFNSGDAFVPVNVHRAPQCFPEGCDRVAAARSAFILPIENEPTGAFIFMPRSGAEKISFNLQIWDESAKSGLYGAEIPVVREDRFTSGTLRIMNARVSEFTRSTLRIYELDNLPVMVQVRITDLYGIDVPAVEFSVQLAPQRSDDFVTRPAYAVVSNFETILPKGWRDHSLMLELAPATSGPRIWGFVTITNNDSQGVTVCSPDRQ